MRIAITMNLEKNLLKNDVINQGYIKYFENLGFFPILLPSSIKNPGKYCKQLEIEGLILSGGIDISKNLINTPRQFRRKKAWGRDLLEWNLLEISLEMKLPVLGICRGMQFINVFFGGNIIYDIKNTLNTGIIHVSKNHEIIIANQEFAEVFGRNNFSVNSFHCHGITSDVIASPIRSFAFCDDGIIEGLFHPEHSIIGIQWHPEREGSTVKCDHNFLKAFFFKGKFW